MSTIGCTSWAFPSTRRGGRCVTALPLYAWQPSWRSGVREQRCNAPAGSSCGSSSCGSSSCGVHSTVAAEMKLSCSICWCNLELLPNGNATRRDQTLHRALAKPDRARSRPVVTKPSRLLPASERPPPRRFRSSGILALQPQLQHCLSRKSNLPFLDVRVCDILRALVACRVTVLRTPHGTTEQRAGTARLPLLLAACARLLGELSFNLHS